MTATEISCPPERKAKLVLKVLKGEPLAAVSAAAGVGEEDLARWVAEFEARAHLAFNKGDRRSEGHSEFRLALDDIAEGLFNWPLWYRMSVLDTRRRYRRTVLGPFWTTLSMAFMILGMGVVFSRLWKMDIQTYLPFLTASFIAWGPITSTILESASGFISAQGVLTSVRTPYSVFCVNIVFRNLIVMLHHMVIYVIVAILLTVEINGLQLFAIPALILYLVNGVWISLLVGIVCARFRDVTPFINSALQILVFISPIFWPPEQLGRRGLGLVLVDANPFYHFVEILRAPLLGHLPSLLTYQVVGGITLGGWLVTLFVFSRYRRRIIYWL